jgi:hypothetical protein
MARAPLLQLSGISLTFGGNPVFDDLSLSRATVLRWSGGTGPASRR